MIRRPPRSTLSSSSAASDVYKRQIGFRQAADLGIDNLEHGLVVDTEFYSKKQPDTCPMRDFRALLTEYNDQLSVESAQVQDVIHSLVAHHVAITSTLAVFEEGLG